MSFIKSKAIFMIVLISIISFTFYIPQVNAQQQECCERTRDGSFCLYTDASNCDPSSQSAPAFCEDTSFCTLGCCFDSNSGECFSNTAKSECDQVGGTWDPSQSCSQVSQCSAGCCQLNNQAFLSTLTKCKQVVSQFSDTEPSFDASIQDEFTCLNSVRSQEQGCCVTESSCTFTTRSQCSLQEVSPIENIEEAAGEEITGAQIAETTNQALGFHPGTLCSLDSLGCTAAKQHKLGCFNEDVYWFDSEGNPENVFLGNSGPQKRAAYNDGRILDNPGCEAQPNDPNCGNCDYTKGTICSESSREPRCIDLNCKDTTTFQNSPDSGSNKELGESWCIFDGPIGFGQDRPGSRHFRAACVNGEEIIEPCADFREEFCTQSVSGGSPTNQYGSFYQALTQNLPTLKDSSPISDIFQGPSYSEAACRDNRVDSCLDCNQFSTLEETQQCCNEKAYRDCYFLQAGISNKGGTCIPNVPEGARFWSDSQSVLARQTTRTTEGQDQTIIDNVPSVPADDVCSIANEECEVGFSRTTFSDWKCTYNCHCLTEDYFIAAHSVCRAINDCGASFNFAGEVTRKGFDIKVLGPDGEVDVPSGVRKNINVKQFRAEINAGLFDNQLIKEPREGGSPKKYSFSDFFGDSAVPLGIIGVTGLTAALTAGKLGGFIGGAFLGPSYAFGGLSGLIGGQGSAVNALVKGGFGETFVTTTIEKGASLAGQSFTSAVPITTTSESALAVGSTFSGVSTGEKIPQLLVDQALTGKIEIVKEGVVKPLTGDLLINQKLKAGTKFTVKALGEGATLPADISGELIGQGADGMKALQSTAIPPQTTLGGQILGAINIIAWVWTIYNIIDLFGADTVTGKVQFVCKAWEPPSGGDNCNLCNEGPLGEECSEYRCRSLGKGCELINEGTKNPLCVSSLPDDSKGPRIAADKEKINYIIQDDPNIGFTIIDPIPPFTAVSLAIQTDEPAQCKFSTESSNFEDKEFDFGSSLLNLNHQMDFSLPSELTEEQALQLTNGGKYTLYVQCEDANGNSQNKDYIIKFQIQKGPDVEPTKIQSTSILSGTLIQSGVEAVSLDLFVNEPSSCKWSDRDIDYNIMENTLVCSNSASEIVTINSGSYKCSISLPLQISESGSITNTYYFRCADRDNNQNQNSFRYSLISTSSLLITETSPEGILRSGSGITLEVKTTNGAENGIAICGYSQEDLPFINIPPFQNTNSNTHTQTLQLLEQGANNFFITCIDLAGNEAKSTIQFTVEADTVPPILFSVFKDTQLGIISITTNEPTTCQYSDQQFEYGSGIPMTNENSITHEASLGSTIYIIKCEDEFNNLASFTVFP